jgi:hypothetical protein
MKNTKLRLRTATIILLMCSVGGVANATPFAGSDRLPDGTKSTPLLEQVQYTEERGYYYTRRTDWGCRGGYGCEGGDSGDGGDYYRPRQNHYYGGRARHQESHYSSDYSEGYFDGDCE